MRECTKSPKTVRVGGGEGPGKGIETVDICIQTASREFVVSLCQHIRSLFAPIIKLILLLIAKLRSHKGTTSENNFIPALDNVAWVVVN